MNELDGYNLAVIPVERFAEDESGATAVEYALIVAALSVVIGAVLQRIGVTLDSVFRTLQQTLLS